MPTLCFIADEGLARVEDNVQQRFLVVGYDCHQVCGSKKLKKEVREE